MIHIASPDLKLLYQPGKGGNSQQITAIVGSMLRLGIRDFGQAIQREGVAVSGPGRELWALRRTGRLTAEEIPGVNRAIDDLVGSVAKPRGKGRLYSITILLTPLDHRARKSKSKTNPSTRKSL